MLPVGARSLRAGGGARWSSGRQQVDGDTRRRDGGGDRAGRQARQRRQAISDDINVMLYPLGYLRR